MSEQEFMKMVSMLSKIAYELHDDRNLDGKAREMLLDFWREFSCYEEPED